MAKEMKKDDKKMPFGKEEKKADKKDKKPADKKKK